MEDRMNAYEKEILHTYTYVVQYEDDISKWPFNFLPPTSRKLPYPMYRTNNKADAWETVKEVQPRAKWIKVYVKGQLKWEWTP